MHYSNLVIIEETGDIEKAVEQAMGAHEDKGGFWDWYQIGGRWTGALDGYDPEKDERNIKTCSLCGGTGDRKDLSPPEWKAECGGCNGCHGTGKEIVWPTSWAKHPGDVAPIETVTDEAFGRFYRIVTPFGRHYERERYTPWAEDKFQKLDMPPLAWLKKEYEGHLVVVVDNHS